MRLGLRDRIAFALERVPLVRRAILRYDGMAPGGRLRYENRLNGHLVVREPRR